MERALFRASVVAGWFLAVVVGARGDEAPAVVPEPTPVPAPAPDLGLNVPAVGLVEGGNVNLRIGPRMDARPIAQLDEGTVLVIVERLGEWLGVRVPQGFPAAVSLEYGELQGADAVRVMGSNVNLRLHPPEEGKTPPAAFRDRPTRGAVLTLIDRKGDWAWVVAPEDVRAYVHTRFIRELGPVEGQEALINAARAKRDQEAQRLSSARRGQMAEQAGKSLMSEVAAAQDGLYRLRLSGNKDKTPVVELATRLDLALEAAALCPGRLLTIARALREDLEREIALTVARSDAEMAKWKGLPQKPVPSPAPKRPEVEIVGTIRYEETPNWKEKGVYLLWIDEAPAYALRLTVGAELPLPDLRENADGRPRRIRGVQPGDRLFGFPVIDIKSLRPVEGAVPAPPIVR
jgi:hypothetical protein